MAVQSNVYVINEGKSYHATKPIVNKEHMAVWLAQFNPEGTIPPKDLWVQVDVTDYDLINNCAVFISDFQQEQFEFAEVRVADAPNEILQRPSDYSIIAIIADDIQIVADISDEVEACADMAIEIVNCGSEPLMSAIIACGTEPLTTAILNAEQNAILARASADSANESQEFSRQWSSENFDEPVDDGEHIGRSSYHWSIVASLNAQGLTLQGSWNPNGGSDPVTPNPPLEDGMWWVVTEDSLAPVYGKTWRASDKIVYMASETPDPWIKLENIVHWDNIIGTPQSLSVEIEEIITLALETHFVIPHIQNSLIIRHNGITLAPSDYTEDAFDLEGISNGFTLNVAPNEDDLIHAQGVLARVPASDTLVGYWNTQAERLTAASYAREAHGTFVDIYTSNGDGTFTETPTTDYSSLHWEEESQLRSWESEAQEMTAQSRATEPEDVLCKIWSSNGNGTFSQVSDTFYSAFHWSEKAKIIASGVTFLGTWDASTGVYPADGTQDGDYYICNVNGSVAAMEYKVGDWIIWETTSSSWNHIPWTYDWSTLTNVPQNVTNAIDSTGDTMTGQLKTIEAIDPEDAVNKAYVDGLSGYFFSSHTDVTASADTFIITGIHYIQFKYSGVVPSNSRGGTMTVSNGILDGVTFVEQMWKTKDQIFIRASQDGYWSNWVEK